MGSAQTERAPEQTVAYTNKTSIRHHAWLACDCSRTQKTNTHAHAEHTRRERWSGTAGIAIRRLSRKCQKNCSPRSDREERAGRLRFGVVAELKLAMDATTKKQAATRNGIR